MLNLAENVTEERVHSMMCSELLFEDKELVNIIVDSVEEWTQEVRPTINIFHLQECFLINLMFLLSAYLWNTSLLLHLTLNLLFSEQFLNFLDLN